VVRPLCIEQRKSGDIGRVVISAERGGGDKGACTESSACHSRVSWSGLVTIQPDEERGVTVSVDRAKIESVGMPAIQVGGGSNPLPSGDGVYTEPSQPLCDWAMRGSVTVSVDRAKRELLFIMSAKFDGSLFPVSPQLGTPE
jgi:hypothetical protein